MKNKRCVFLTIMVTGLLLAAWFSPVLASRVQPLAQHLRAAVESGGFTEYVVQPGDSLSGIAARFLNSARNWQMLLKYNRIANPHLIYPNQRIVIPVADRAKAEAAIRAAQAVRAVRGAQPEADDMLSNAMEAFGQSEFGIAFGLAERARLLYETVAERAAVPPGPAGAAGRPEGGSAPAVRAAPVRRAGGAA